MSSTNPAMIINLPPHNVEDVQTPDLPGTPNSGTTTMSELSTVAIKDGHRGHLPHAHHQPMDAERADRISRLAGLDRVAQPRNLTPGTAAQQPAQTYAPTQGYFDANNQPQILRERSTVGSASATGSVGGRTTWASGSEVYDHDKMSEDLDTSSMGGFSDAGDASLVGFGEGARTPARQQSQYGSPVVGKATPVPSGLREVEDVRGGSPMSVSGGVSGNATPDARMVGEGVADPTLERGQETTERLMRERHERGDDRY